MFWIQFLASHIVTNLILVTLLVSVTILILFIRSNSEAARDAKSKKEALARYARMYWY